MRTVIALLLCSSVALADPPGDTPLADVPDTSVRLVLGQPAPFAGRLLSPEENVRRAKKLADCEATLADAEQGVLLPKPAVAVLISGAAAAIIASVVLGVALAAKK
jgi:hypothetical protein